MTGRRMVSLSSTTPDGFVVEVEVGGPANYPPDALRSRLVAAIDHAVTVYESGTPVDVAIGDMWLSARVIP